MKRISLMLALALPLSTWAQTPLESARDAVEAGDYEEAVRIYSELADNGDNKARYNLALMYTSGTGVAKDRAKGMALLEEAAKELPAAQYMLGSALLFGEDGMTLYEAPSMQSHNTPSQADRDRGMALIRQAAEQELPLAEDFLAQAYQGNYGVPADGKEALFWLEKGVARGSSEAMYELGSFYLAGMPGIPSDCRKALHWFGETGKAGDWTGYAQISRMYAEGVCVPHDAGKAQLWQAISGYFMTRQS